MKRLKFYRAIVAIAMMLIGWLPSLALSFKVEVNGVEVKEGDEIELTDLEAGTLPNDQVIIAHMKLTNLTSNPINASALGEFLELAQAPTPTGKMAEMTQFCFDSCYSFMQDDNGVWKGGGPCKFGPNEVRTGNKAHVEYRPAYEGMGFWDVQELYPGVSILKFTLKNNDDESDAITFYLKFDNTNTETCEYNGLEYNIYLKEKVAKVASCNSNLSIINIPETIEYNGTTYSVTSIGDYAFRGCTYLTAVVIPNSVTKLGEFVFNEYTKYINCLAEIPPTISENTLLYNEWGMKIIDASLYVPKGLKSVYESNEYWNKLSIYENEPEVGSTFIFDGWEYEITNKGKEVSLISSQCVTINGDINIPETVQLLNTTYSVTSIADNMFSSWGNTQSITIPKTIKYIGSGAFSCTKKSDAPVYISDIEAWCNIEFGNIHSNPLFGAGDLYLNGELIENLVIPDGVKTIPDYAFYDLPHIKSLTIPNSVVSIGNSAFYGCSGISEKLHISNSVTEIGNNAFYNCFGIESLSLGESLETIGAYAFHNCYNLSNSLIIPNKIRRIELGAFDGCSGLTDLTLGESVEAIEDNAFSGCSSLTGSLNIPNSVNYIGRRAFNDCKELRNVTIGESVSSIGSEVFANCENIVSVNIPASLNYIGHNAFINCNRLNDLYINDLKSYCDIEWEVIGNHGMEFSSPLDYASNLYLNEELIEDLVIPDDVTKISDKLFYDLDHIKSISIPNSVTSIGSNAFQACEGVTNLSIGNSVTSIGNHAFDGCVNLIGFLTLPASLESIGTDAFNSTNYLVSRVLMDTPIMINEHALPTSLLTLIVPAGTKKAYKESAHWKDIETIIEEGSCDIEVTNHTAGKLMEVIATEARQTPALVTGMKVIGTLNDTDIAAIKSNMTSLLRLDISETDYVALPDKAFKDKLTLLEIILPNRLESIGSEAFSGCVALSDKIILPETVTSIGISAFENCKSMSAISLSIGLTSIGNSAFKNCISLREIYMPNTITSIGSEAYYGCINLVAAALPTTLTSISDGLFNGCKKLADFDYPTAITTIGNSAFYGCSSLTIVDLSECRLLTSIGNSAFDGCSKIETINFPTSLTSIGISTFRGCRSLIEMSVPTMTPPTIADDSKPFEHVDNLACVLSIPEESTIDYLIAQYWGAFVSISEKEEINIEIDTENDDENGGNNGNGNGNGHDKHGCDVNYHKGGSHNPNKIPGMYNAPAYVDTSVREANAITYSGSSVFVEGDECVTFLLTPQKGYQIDQVLYDGEDVTSQLVDNTFTTPKAVAGGKNMLKVVLSKNSDFVHATSITLDKEKMEMMTGETLSIVATILPDNATNKEVAWSSSDIQVASVDNTGLVTMYSAGEAIITATTTDGTNLSATCYINVYSGINGVYDDEVIVATIGDNIVVKNATKGSVVRVYSIDGAMIASDIATDGSVVIEAPIKGIYVVVVDNKSFKVMVK